MYKSPKLKAFTLAEVLITLMVIGILAVITIPSILQSWEERVTVTKLKRIYSELQQAYKMAELEYGPPETWQIKENVLLDPVVPYLPVLKNCKNNSGQGCIGTYYQTKNGLPADGGWYLSQAAANFDNLSWMYKVLLKDGSSIGGFIHPPSLASWQSCSAGPSIDGYGACAIIYADVNGPKPPNILGKDTFWFVLTKIGFIPLGGANIQTTNVKAKHVNGCTQTGYACTRWIIERGNMDYLHEDTTW